MSSSIEELQKRIAEIQAISAGLSIPVKEDKIPSEPISKSEPNIRDIIREEIRLAMGSTGNSTIVKPEPAPEPSKELTFLEIIDKEFTQEEKLWLSNPEVLKAAGVKLNLYLQTPSGNSFLKEFLRYFKESYEN